MNKNADQLTREASVFFEAVDAAALRDDLMEIFLQYVIAQHTALPMDFDKMGERFCLLTDFLKNIDQIKNRRPPNLPDISDTPA